MMTFAKVLLAAGAALCFADVAFGGGWAALVVAVSLTTIAWVIDDDEDGE